MTYYLKYRPQTLEELDLESVREQLKKIVSSGQIPHAFLFAGPKGTGKTSAARIIAKVVNCEQRKKKDEPCNKCDQCKSITGGNNIDVLELDAASNRGIDDVRALRDAIKLAPARAKKKVYIIDEAHMLTLDASNALLKTLEEPPEHVIFILATTNPEKLIGTIRSRTVNILFKRATITESVRSLSKVAKGEKVKISKEALALVAKASGGSFRDGAKVLEQLVLEKKSLEPDKIDKFLAKTGRVGIEDFLKILAGRQVKEGLLEVEKLIASGTSVNGFLEELLETLRLGLLAKVGVGSDDLADFSQDELIFLIGLFSQAATEVASCLIEQLPVEIAVVKWCGDGTVNNEQRIVNNEEKQDEGKTATQKVTNNLTAKLSEITDDVWRSIVTRIKSVNTSIEALLRAAKPVGFDGNTLTLGVYYKFHKERLEEVSHRKVLEEVAASILGSPIKVTCTLTEPPAKKTVEVPLTEGKDQDIIKIAEEIFGN